MRLRPIIVAAATAAATAVAMAGPAQAAPTPTTLVDNLVGPLSLSVNKGHIYVAQTFGGKLTRYLVNGNGGKDLFVRDPKIGIGGVEAKGPGTLFTVTGETAGGQTFAQVVHLSNKGKKTVVANTRGYEVNNNPDHGKVYGFRDLSNKCAGKVPAQIGGEPYRGKVDSHPYATARTHSGSILVADAGGNDLLRVSKSGAVSTVAVFPATAEEGHEGAAHQPRTAQVHGRSQVLLRSGPDRRRGARAQGLRDDAARRTRGPEPRRARQGLPGQPAQREREAAGQALPRRDGCRRVTDRQGLCRGAVRQPHLDHLPPQAPDGARVT